VWPDGFAPPASEAAPSVKWHEDVSEIAGLRIRVEYPDGWTLRKNGGDNEIVELKQTGSLSRLSISRPTGVPYSVDRSVPAAQLRQWSDAIRDANKAHGLMLTPLGLGMASAASRTWAWYAYETSTLPLTNAPPAAAAVAQEMFGGARVWVFQATAGGHEVSVMCTAIVARSGSEAQKASALAVQAADFGALIRHITIESFHN
jgi:hypothetical protein